MPNMNAINTSSSIGYFNIDSFDQMNIAQVARSTI